MSFQADTTYRKVTFIKTVLYRTNRALKLTHLAGFYPKIIKKTCVFS